MGREIADLAEERGIELTGTANSLSELRNKKDELQQSEVAIEFTRPEAAPGNIVFCLESGVPVVSGTTGWYEHLDLIRETCDQTQGAFFYASNFSIGVQIFFRINRYLAQWMDTYSAYQVHIDEIHHTQKKDKPSGTAITLAEGILSESNRYTHWQLAPAQDAGLPISAHREGQVPGIHQVRWTSETDEIEITHRAFHRRGFASGALEAAAWLRGKRGIFTMSDLLTPIRL